jgi:uncharacterized protein (DUF2267 family)
MLIAAAVMALVPLDPLARRARATRPDHLPTYSRPAGILRRIAMSRTGIDSLDRSIDKTNTWLADVASSFGTEDRRLAYRVTRSWLHTLRDRLPVSVAAHVAAQLPELLRGVFYDGWNPSKVPIKYDRDEYISRFARDAQIHHTEVPNAGRLVTAAMCRHMSAGVVNEALGVLPADIRALFVPDGDQGHPNIPGQPTVAGQTPVGGTR